MSIGSKPMALLLGRTSGGVNVPLLVSSAGSLVASAPQVIGSVTPGQNSGAGLTTIYTLNLPAGLLKTDGDALIMECGAVMANNANLKLTALVFGGSIVASRSGIADAALNRKHRATLMRVTATTQIAFGTTTLSGGVLEDFSSPTETLANSIQVLFKAQGSADADILAKYITVQYVPAGTVV